SILTESNIPNISSAEGFFLDSQENRITHPINPMNMFFIKLIFTITKIEIPLIFYKSKPFLIRIVLDPIDSYSIKTEGKLNTLPYYIFKDSRIRLYYRF
ncbi:MAG: hypothetical protein ACI9L9_000712, partial [Marivirga sp.]